MFGGEGAQAVSAEEPRDVARLREAFASLAGGGQGSVDAERIFDALHGNLSAEERHAIVDELLVNPDAAEAWNLAREMAPESAVKGSAPVETWKWMSLAAAAVVAVVVGWQFGSPWRPVEEPVYRGVESKAITSALTPGAVLARAQPVLRWTGVEGARYRVRVLTPELDVLAETEELSGSAYVLGAEVLRRVPPGSQILWQVEGRVPGAAAIVSPTFSVRVE